MHQTAQRGPRRKLSDIFSKDEIAQLTDRSGWMGWRALSGLLARVTVAPLRVNHHIEHHLMPAAHRMLCERGLAAPPPSDLDVPRIASAPVAGL